MAITSASVATDLVKTITACRACGSGSLDVVLDLGVHAVSDFYDTVPEDELRAPLCLCQCGGCGLVQLTVSVDKDRLYRDYWYRSGLNPAMVAALKDVVDDAVGRVTLETGDAVLDIGANDGTLLLHYPRGLVCWGIEPSQIGREVRRADILMVDGFYPEKRMMLDSDQKIITSIACFYDLDDPNAFVKAIKEDLHPEGVWVNQMMDMSGMFMGNAVDNICHEHVAYWSLANFNRIVTEHGLRIDAHSRNDVNGGSIRLTMKHGQGDWTREPLPAENYGIRHFAKRIRGLKNECRDFLEGCRHDGKTVAGLGASTKFNTLLQYYGIGTDLLPWIMDRNPDKWGKITAGSHIPIVSEEEGRARNPDYFLVGPYHFLDNLIEREAAYLKNGGHFVAPLPTFKVIGG